MAGPIFPTYQATCFFSLSTILNHTLRGRLALIHVKNYTMDHLKTNEEPTLPDDPSAKAKHIFKLVKESLFEDVESVSKTFEDTDLEDCMSLAKHIIAAKPELKSTLLLALDRNTQSDWDDFYSCIVENYDGWVTVTPQVLLADAVFLSEA